MKNLKKYLNIKKNYTIFYFKIIFFFFNIILIIKIIINIDSEFIKEKLPKYNYEINNYLLKICNNYKTLLDRNKCINENKQLLKNKFKFKNFYESKIYLDKYETNIYNKIKKKLINYNCSEMWDNQKEFLNGVIRKFKPKKIVEIGVSIGGSSIIILNAIKDINNSHLYSIDLSKDNKIGKCVKKYFFYLLNKWSLFKGNVVPKFIENIGDDIDMIFIDSSHFEPGEILNGFAIFKRRCFSWIS